MKALYIQKARHFIGFTLVFVFFSAGIKGQNALSFDGTNDYVGIPAASALISGSTHISMTMWVYPANLNPAWPDYDGFAGFRNDTNADFYLVQLSPSGLEARFRNSAGTAFSITYQNLQPNTWQHYTLTYNGAVLKLYHNGTEVGSVPATGTISNNTLSLYLGKLVYYTTTFYFNGKLDEFSLWNKTLTLEEIQHIYTCAVDPASANLLLYYKFDQGVAGGNNPTVTTLLPDAGTLNGTLFNFALTGNTSNWVAGVSTPVNYINASICNGESYQFGTQTLTTPGVYTQTFSTPSGCDSVVELTLTIFSPNISVTLIGVTLTAQLSGAVYKWVDCNNGYAAIPFATGQSYTATANGSYAVIITQNNCTDTSNCVNVTTVGLPGSNTVKGLAFYPNPVTDLLSINLGKQYNEAKLEVFNLEGQELISTIYSNQQLVNQDLTFLKPGIYIASLMIGDQTVFFKFIK